MSKEKMVRFCTKVACFDTDEIQKEMDYGYDKIKYCCISFQNFHEDQHPWVRNGKLTIVSTDTDPVYGWEILHQWVFFCPFCGKELPKQND